MLLRSGLVPEDELVDTGDLPSPRARVGERRRGGAGDEGGGGGVSRALPEREALAVSAERAVLDWYRGHASADAGVEDGSLASVHDALAYVRLEAMTSVAERRNAEARAHAAWRGEEEPSDEVCRFVLAGAVPVPPPRGENVRVEAPELPEKPSPDFNVQFHRLVEKEPRTLNDWVEYEDHYESLALAFSGYAEAVAKVLVVQRWNAMHNLPGSGEPLPPVAAEFPNTFYIDGVLFVVTMNEDPHAPDVQAAYSEVKMSMRAATKVLAARVRGVSVPLKAAILFRGHLVVATLDSAVDISSPVPADHPGVRDVLERLAAWYSLESVEMPVYRGVSDHRLYFTHPERVFPRRLRPEYLRLFVRPDEPFQVSEAYVRKAEEHLTSTVLPLAVFQLCRQLASATLENGSPALHYEGLRSKRVFDVPLSKFFHSRGINMRYLGVALQHVLRSIDQYRYDEAFARTSDLEYRGKIRRGSWTNYSHDPVEVALRRGALGAERADESGGGDRLSRREGMLGVFFLLREIVLRTIKSRFRRLQAYIDPADSRAHDRFAAQFVEIVLRPLELDSADHAPRPSKLAASFAGSDVPPPSTVLPPSTFGSARRFWAHVLPADIEAKFGVSLPARMLLDFREVFLGMNGLAPDGRPYPEVRCKQSCVKLLLGSRCLNIRLTRAGRQFYTPLVRNEDEPGQRLCMWYNLWSSLAQFVYQVDERVVNCEHSVGAIPLELSSPFATARVPALRTAVDECERTYRDLADLLLAATGCEPADPRLLQLHAEYVVFAGRWLSGRALQRVDDGLRLHLVDNAPVPSRSETHKARDEERRVISLMSQQTDVWEELVTGMVTDGQARPGIRWLRRGAPLPQLYLGQSLDELLTSSGPPIIRAADFGDVGAEPKKRKKKKKRKKSKKKKEDPQSLLLEYVPDSKHIAALKLARDGALREDGRLNRFQRLVNAPPVAAEALDMYSQSILDWHREMRIGTMAEILGRQPGEVDKMFVTPEVVEHAITSMVRASSSFESGSPRQLHLARFFAGAVVDYLLKRHSSACVESLLELEERLLARSLEMDPPQAAGLLFVRFLAGEVSEEELVRAEDAGYYLSLQRLRDVCLIRCDLHLGVRAAERAVVAVERIWGPAHPETCRARLVCAWVYVLRREWQRCLQHCTELLRLVPSDHAEARARVVLMYGVACKHLGELTKARKAYPPLIEVLERTGTMIAFHLENDSLALDPNKMTALVAFEDLNRRCIDVVPENGMLRAVVLANAGFAASNVHLYAEAVTRHMQAAHIFERVCPHGTRCPHATVELLKAAVALFHLGKLVDGGPLVIRGLDAMQFHLFDQNKRNISRAIIFKYWSMVRLVCKHIADHKNSIGDPYAFARMAHITIPMIQTMINYLQRVPEHEMYNDPAVQRFHWHSLTPMPIDASLRNTTKTLEELFVEHEIAAVAAHDAAKIVFDSIMQRGKNAKPPVPPPITRHVLSAERREEIRQAFQRLARGEGAFGSEREPQSNGDALSRWYVRDPQLFDAEPPADVVRRQPELVGPGGSGDFAERLRVYRCELAQAERLDVEERRRQAQDEEEQRRRAARYTCAHCSAQGDVVKQRCSGCRLVYYCDRKCQRAHWKEHKAACKQAQRG